SPRVRAIIKLVMRNGFLILMGAMGGWAQAPPAAPVERGRVQFAQSCGFCHGPNANGGTHGPNLIRSAVVRHDENGNLIGPVIRDGRPELGMPPVPLRPNQVSDIV